MRRVSARREAGAGWPSPVSPPTSCSPLHPLTGRLSTLCGWGVGTPWALGYMAGQPGSYAEGNGLEFWSGPRRVVRSPQRHAAGVKVPAAGAENWGAQEAPVGSWEPPGWAQGGEKQAHSLVV